MKVSKDIENAITDIVRTQFFGNEICCVDINAGKDSDGDPVLKIFVVFDDKDESFMLDGGTMAALPRHIINHFLDDDGDGLNAFPLVSFISKKDWAKRNREAA